MLGNYGHSTVTLHFVNNKACAWLLKHLISLMICHDRMPVYAIHISLGHAQLSDIKKALCTAEGFSLSLYYIAKNHTWGMGLGLTEHRTRYEWLSCLSPFGPLQATLKSFPTTLSHGIHLILMGSSTPTRPAQALYQTTCAVCRMPCANSILLHPISKKGHPLG